MTKTIRAKVLSLLLMTSFISLLFITPLNLILIPVKSSEFENIDSYNTHPAVRWNQELTTSTETITASEGILEYDDVGLEGQSSAYSRRLAKTDFKVEGRVKTPDVDRTDIVDIDLTGIVREYRFEDSNTTHITDKIGNYNCPMQNSTTLDYTTDTINPGITTKAAFFNATEQDYAILSPNTNDDLTFTDDGDTFPGNDVPFTIEFLMKTNDDSATMFFENNLFALYITTGFLHFELIDDYPVNNYDTLEVDSPVLTDDEWIYVVIRYDGQNSINGLYIFINGEDVSTNRQSIHIGDGVGYEGQGDQGVTYLNSNQGTNLYHGYLDEFRVFKNRNLTNVEILRRYHIFYPDAYVQTMIGITNSETTLDLDVPELCFMMESFDEFNTSDLLISYGFTSDGTFYSQNFFNISKQIWVRFEIEVDILRSEIEFSFNYDNGTNIENSDQTLLDITSSIVVPDIFASSVVNIFYGNNFTSNATIEWQLDFIKAPFEEFSFRHYDGDNTNTKYWNPSEFSCQGKINDTVDKDVTYINVVPDFDSISATMNFYVADPDDAAADINGLYPNMEIRLYNVDETTGALTSIAGVYMGIQTGLPEIRLYDYYEITSQVPNILKVFAQEFSAAMTCYLNPEGTKLILTANMGGSVLSRSVNVTGLGSEWVVKLLYSFDNLAAGDEATITLSITDLDLVSRDLFGFLPDIGDPFGISGIFKTIMTPILVGFRAIGSFFSVIMAPIASLLKPLANLLGGLADGIGGALAGFFSTLKTAIDSVYEVIASVAGAVFTAFLEQIGSLVDDIVSWLITIVADLADLIGAIFYALYAVIIQPYFGWLLDAIDMAIYGYGELWTNYILFWETIILFFPLAIIILTIYIFVLSGAESEGNPVIWVGLLIKKFFINMTEGLTFMGIGVPLPLGLIWYLGAAFYGWSPW